MKRLMIVMALRRTAACGAGTVDIAQPLPRPPPRAAADRQYLLERVGEAAVVQLYADGFNELPLREKTLDLAPLRRRRSPAATSFTTSATRTTSRCATSSKRIVAHPAGVDPATLGEIQRYTKLFWINTGPYNNLTARKFVLDLHARGIRRGRARRRTSRRPLPAAERRNARPAARPAAAACSSIRTSSRSSRTRRRAPGKDILTASANNLYVGVTMQGPRGLRRTATRSTRGS